MADDKDNDKDKLKDFNQKLRDFQKQNDLIADTIHIKRGNIEKEADTLRLLENYHVKHQYIRRMYEDVPEAEIVNMDDVDYFQFQMPLTNSGISGEVATHLHKESLETGYTFNNHQNLTASLCVSGSSDSTSVNILSISQPRWFPNRNRLTDEYKIEDELEKHISSIQKELNASFRDIKDDFDAFIRRYYAFQTDKSQYLDLIGSRSMLFFKLIFDFSESNYGVQTPKNRRNDIRRFIFGSNAPIASAEPIINTCYHLYRELSSQDSSGMSVKLGDVTVAYIEGLFRRLVGNMAVVLDLRARYFSP